MQQPTDSGAGDGPQPYVVPLSPDGRECLAMPASSSEGWARYFSDATQDALVFVRLAKQSTADDAPIEVRELRVTAQRGVDFESQLVRAIPFRRIEAAVNRPQHRGDLEALVESDHVFWTERPAAEQALMDLRRPSERRVQAPRLKLKIPTTRRKPDDFYAQVADRFLWLAATTDGPAEKLAGANGVNVSTVHRWVKEARARGLLRTPTRQSAP